LVGVSADLLLSSATWLSRPCGPCGEVHERHSQDGEATLMKKLILVALAAVGGLLVYRQIQADRAEQDLWTEATDAVPAGTATR
jgi:hypothetical protein